MCLFCCYVTNRKNISDFHHVELYSDTKSQSVLPVGLHGSTPVDDVQLSPGE